MPARPLPLLLTSGVVVAQALTLVVVAILDLADLGGAAGLGVSSAVFFLICAGALGVCAAGLLGCHSWSRAPIVLAQVVELGLSWDARHDSVLLTVVLGVLALAGLIGVLHPATMRALAPREEP